MKLLRHILSHLFLITFLIAVVSVFYYRTLLLPSNVVVKINDYVNEVYPQALKFASKRDYFWSIRGERIVSFDDLKLFAKEETTPAKAKENVSVAVVNAPVKAKENVSVAVVKAPAKAKENASVVAEKNATTNTTTKRVNEPKKETPVKADNNIPASTVIAKNTPSPVVARERVSRSQRDVLVKARNAFNQGNMTLSEKAYLELTEFDQNNPDAYGELGNVYYSQGKWNKAGQAYYEAAVRLMATGKRDQVVYLQRVIQGLNTEHAKKLSQLMLRQH